MKVKFDEISSGFVKWFVINSYTLLDEKSQERYMNGYAGEIDLDFKINGESIDPIAIINEMERQYDDQVKQKAKELINERISDAMTAFDDFDQAKQALSRKLFDGVGVQYSEDDLWRD